VCRREKTASRVQELDWATSLKGHVTLDVGAEAKTSAFMWLRHAAQ
jgi:hypothetical protein